MLKKAIIDYQKKRYASAEHLIRKVLSSNRSNWVAWNYLGLLQKQKKDYQQAMNSFEFALKLCPISAELNCNIGNLCVDLGDMPKAHLYYLKSIEIEPSNTLFQLNYLESCKYLQLINDEIAVEKLLLSYPADNNTFTASVWSAIRDYQQGNLDASIDKLIKSKPLLDIKDYKLQPVQIYWDYLARLIKWRTRNIYFAGNKDARVVYVIGESHSISAHGTFVKYNNLDYQCQSKWIPGVKQWHIQKNSNNKFKFAFNMVLSGLPRGAVILTTIGEIDCRLGEGILEYSTKYKKDLDLVIKTTIDNYLLYIQSVRSDFDFIVCGVPATNVNKNIEQKKIHADLLRKFNHYLKNATHKSGFRFLDVYNLNRP